MKAKIIIIVFVAVGLMLIANDSDCQSNAPKIVKSKDGYTVNVYKPGLVWINVYMEKDGRQVFIGQRPFRVRYLPSPYPAIAGKRGGKINKQFLSEIGRVTAILENVEFEVNYKIVSYSFMSTKDGDFSSSEKNRGAVFNDKVQKLIKYAHRGDRIYFEDIMAKGPDNVTRNIGSLAFVID